MQDANSAKRQQANTRVDPITGAVIQGALESIAIEMGHKLMRMSYSSIIRESEDFGAALTDAQGRQLCECKMSTPLQSGPIHPRHPQALRTARRRISPRRRDHAQRPVRRRLARPRRSVLRAGL
jgi:N-methylhydantoinase B